MRKQFFLKSETGATAVEYGLIVALIALLISASLLLTGTSFNTIMKILSDTLAK